MILFLYFYIIIVISLIFKFLMWMFGVCLVSLTLSLFPGASALKPLDPCVFPTISHCLCEVTNIMQFSLVHVIWKAPTNNMYKFPFLFILLKLLFTDWLNYILLHQGSEITK